MYGKYFLYGKYSLVVFLFILLPLLLIAAPIVDVVPSADGVPIHYQVQGEGKPALVFVHCWSCDRSYWDAQVKHFAQQYTVVTIDLGGHGESGLGRKQWTMKAFGEDVAAVIKKLDLDQIVLIGHSMGGTVVIETARRIPERIIGVVGIDTLHDVNPMPQEQIDQFLPPLRANFAEFTRNWIRSIFAPETDPALVERIANDMAAAPPEVAIGATEELVTYDLATAFEEVQAPIRCINADMFPTNVEGNQRQAKSFEVVIMSGVGHFPMLEKPEAFNVHLDNVVKELISLTSK